MSGMHFVLGPDTERPRTIAHALELFQDKDLLSESTNLEISVGPVLLVAKPARSFCLKLKTEKDDVIHAVLLSACMKVRAIREGNSTIATFDIQDLNQATVDTNEVATLRNGAKIRGIEAAPIHLPFELSTIDRRILRVLIKMIRGERKVYRSLRKGVPKLVRKGVPKLQFLDFAALYKFLARPSIKIPALKQIQFAYSEMYQNERAPSLTKISDTLRNAGLRNIVPRQRS